MTQRLQALRHVCLQENNPVAFDSRMKGNAMREPRCIIMAAGDFTPMDIDVQEGDYVIAADNGLTYLTRLGIVPDYCIGDYDSLTQEGRTALQEMQNARPGAVMTLPVEKDDTDMMAAAREGLRRGYRIFYLYGALGGARLDHTIANLQTLAFLKENGARAYIMDAGCMLFTMRSEERRFGRGFVGDFSIFAMDHEVPHVTIRGMKYCAEDVTLTNAFPIGVSNHITGEEEAAVSVGDGTALCYVSWQ